MPTIVSVLLTLEESRTVAAVLRDYARLCELSGPPVDVSVRDMQTATQVFRRLADQFKE